MASEVPSRTVKERVFDKQFFDSYEDISVHRTMIQDTPRLQAYKSAISFYHHLINGKVVLDVGCGTGILSIYCAQAGAKKVYAVEAANVALTTKSVIKDNNLADIITVHHGRVEDVKIDEHVDVIVSEWMGYMLFHENMLPSIITARNRWLKDEGLLLPSSAKLFIAPFTHHSRYHENVGFWSNVDGIDMSAFMPSAESYFYDEPNVETIGTENLLGKPHEVINIDIYSVTVSDLYSVTSTFKFNSLKSAPLHGFALWFETDFSPRKVELRPDNKLATNIEAAPAHVLSTAPGAPPTHWKQTLIDCEDVIEVEQYQSIEGSLAIRIDKENHRTLDIELMYLLGGKSFKKVTKF